MPSRRIERINELLKREISRFVLERQHPDVGFTTFTGVQITEDLERAKVFYSVMGTDDEKARTAEALDRMRSEITRSLRRFESLRRIPILQFVFDDTPAKAARVSELLEKIHDEAPEPPEEPR